MIVNTISSETFDISRYSRQILLEEIGILGQSKLKNSKVFIIGCGGLGAPIIQYLAAAGIGHITLCDGDSVELSNLNRQTIFKHDDVGKNKAAAAQDFISALNRDVVVQTIERNIGLADIRYYISQHDLVLDCTDSLPIKFLINDACILSNKPFIHGAASALDGRMLFVIGNDGPCLRCLFPEIPPLGSIKTCSTIGILGPVCGVVGGAMAVYSILFLIGKPYKGTYLVWNFLSPLCMTANQIIKNQDCIACGNNQLIHNFSEEDYSASICNS